MAETQTMSELDRIMQTYIDSGQYSDSELAEIRKREANKIKEKKQEPVKIIEGKGMFAGKSELPIGLGGLVKKDAVSEIKKEEPKAEVSDDTTTTPVNKHEELKDVLVKEGLCDTGIKKSINNRNIRTRRRKHGRILVKGPRPSIRSFRNDAQNI